MSDGKRYFFIVFVHITGAVFGAGSVFFVTGGEHPCKKKILSAINRDDVQIINIHEFKSKADYDDYMRK